MKNLTLFEWLKSNGYICVVDEYDGDYFTIWENKKTGKIIEINQKDGD